MLLSSTLEEFSKSPVKISIPNIGPAADTGVQAVSQQVTVSHPPGGRLPLLSDRHVVTFPAAEHRRPLAGTKLYCLVTEATHRVSTTPTWCWPVTPTQP